MTDIQNNYHKSFRPSNGADGHGYVSWDSGCIRAEAEGFVTTALISSYAKMPTPSLQFLLDDMLLKEQKNIEKLERLMRELTESSSMIASQEKALAIQRYQLPTECTNEWTDTRDGATRTSTGELPMDMRIQNAAFKGHIRVWEDPKRGKMPYDYVCVWKVNYEVSVNTDNFPDFMGHSLIVKSLGSPRPFDTREDAMAYAAKKKEALTKEFFSEMNPVISKKYESEFSYLGTRLPPHRFESEV